jgi:hypothetical protein
MRRNGSVSHAGETHQTIRGPGPKFAGQALGATDHHPGGKAHHHGHAAKEQPPPMTPPRVAGVSFAPQMDPELAGEVETSGNSTGQQQQHTRARRTFNGLPSDNVASGGGGGMNKSIPGRGGRPPPIKVQPGAGGGGGHHTRTRSHDEQEASLQLVAEGRAVGSNLQPHGSLAAELPASRLPARTTSTPAPGALGGEYEPDEGPLPHESSKCSGELLQLQDSPDARRRVYREIHGLQDSYSEWWAEHLTC